MFKHYKFLVECLQGLRANPNANLKISIATFVFNISAEFVNNQTHKQETVLAYANEAIEAVLVETNPDNLLKYLVACANFAVSDKQGNIKNAVKTTLANFSTNDHKCQECLSDLKRIR